jgi:hypothetical protein
VKIHKMSCHLLACDALCPVVVAARGDWNVPTVYRDVCSRVGFPDHEKTARGFPQIVSEMAGNRKDWDASDIGAPPNRPLALDESRGRRR